MSALDPRDVQALGFSLLHFIWQGTALAALLAGLNLLLRHAAPQVRYLLAAATLGAMLLAPALTFLTLRHGVLATPAVPVGEQETPSVSGHGVPGAAVSSDGLRRPAAVYSSAATHREDMASWVGTGLRLRLEPWLPAFVSLWCAGVLALSLRTLGGFALVQQLKRSRLDAPPPVVRETVARLREALRVTAAVQVFESALVHAPTVIGCFRPVVLVPVSVLTGLTPQQLELILAHELAHIRRRDYLVNLLQTAVETLLFYHPAVFWVSGRMRVEREHCCDDLAVAACGSPVRYARALADLEGLCAEAPALAMAASGGSLLERIARLVQPPRPLSAASRGLSVLLVVLAVGLALAVGVSFVGGSSARLAHAAAMPPEEPPSAPGLPQTSPPETTDEKCERCPAPDMANETPEGESECDSESECADCNSECVPCDCEEESADEGEAAVSPEAHAVSATAADSRAFSLERILELARAGVTPEYVDQMDALGFSSLSAEQLVAFRNHGVSPEYVKELAEAGFGGLSPDQLTSLRSQGISAEYVREMKAQGLGQLSLSDLLALRAQGISAESVAEMKKAGYEDLSVSKLLALRAQGVDGRYIVELKALGYSDLSVGKLLALRAQGITPQYVRALADLGYPRLEVPKLLALRAQGVEPEWIATLKQAGLSDLSPGALIALRAAGVSSEFIREIKDAGLDALTAEELIELKNNGVRPDLLKRLRGRM
jgi:beta-lactamase regulating signal transducer with metallopeptidase domain